MDERNWDEMERDDERRDDGWYEFAINNEPDKMLYALDKGYDANTKVSNGTTALMFASLEGLREVAELLLDDGAASKEGGFTALHMAARNGHKDIVDLLLQRGAYVKAKDNNAYTPLHMSESPSTAEILLMHDADMTSRDSSGRKPLEYMRWRITQSYFNDKPDRKRGIIASADYLSSIPSLLTKFNFETPKSYATWRITTDFPSGRDRLLFCMKKASDRGLADDAVYSCILVYTRC